MLPVDEVTDWFDQHARSLPWRDAGATPWRVLVSEFMLQQTPVARVIPLFTAWMTRWPTPAELAVASGADVLRAWANLGYPRRALWLRDAAVAIAERHGGEVPDSLDALLALTGVGDYTARAVLAFGFRRRVPVIDTNVRRVLARASRGVSDSPIRPAVDMAELEGYLPVDEAVAARASLALMEFGALVCTARNPSCGACPIAATCAWRAAGYPASTTTRRRQASYEGSDRQVRGLILAALRSATVPVPITAETIGWHSTAQVAGAIASLAADGLIVPTPKNQWTLPHD